jgi:hypothetical protein
MKYYYLIPEDDLVYDHVKYSMMSICDCPNPTTEMMIMQSNALRRVYDTNTKTRYVVIKMGYSFSTPYKGHHAYSVSDIKTILLEERWEHNE